MKRFIVLVVLAALVLRLWVLYYGVSVNEVRHGDFELNFLWDKSISLMLALALTLVMVYFFQVGVLSSQFSSYRSGLLIVYILMAISLAIKIIAPGSKYIDMIIPTTVLGYTLMFEGMSKKSATILLIGVLYLLLIGVANHSKGAALRVVFGYIVFWIVLGRQLRLKTIFAAFIPIVTLVYITFQMVYFRANNAYFSLSQIGGVALFALDIITMRFNFIDGIFISRDIEELSIGLGDFVHNMFVYLPFVDSSGYTMGAYVACEIDLNCSGEHAGALGFPAVLNKLNWLNIVVFFGGFAGLMLIYRQVNKVMPLSLQMGAAGAFTLSFLNVFISGNLDLIFSQMILTVLGISMVNWLGRLRVCR